MMRLMRRAGSIYGLALAVAVMGSSLSGIIGGYATSAAASAARWLPLPSPKSDVSDFGQSIMPKSGTPDFGREGGVRVLSTCSVLGETPSPAALRASTSPARGEVK